jgi:hypothetical protein
MRLKMGGLAARTAVSCAVAAVLVGGVTQVALAQTHPAVPRVQHKSVTVQIPVKQLNNRLLKHAMVARAARTQDAVPLADTPTCPANWADGNLNVNWTYDTSTGITLSSNSAWFQRISCVNMAYEQVLSSLFYNSNRVADGNTNSCGTPTSTTNQCFSAAVVSSGSWACTAGCAGGYQMSSAAQITLPAGWVWTGTAPVGCFDNPAMTTMICSFGTGVVNVPVLNN